MPRADQAQGEAQPGQPAGDGPGRRRAGRRRRRPARRERALGPGRRAARCRRSPRSRCRPTRRRCSAAGSSAAPPGLPDAAEVARTSPGVGSLGVRAADASPAARGPRRPSRPRPGRSLHPAGARGPRADPRTRRRSRHPDPPAHLRPDRPAAVARRDRGVRRRPRSGRLRAAGRSPAGQPPLRRALGQALAGRLGLRRLQRLLQRRHRPAAGLPLSRLRHPIVQRRPAARPDRPRATGRRRAGRRPSRAGHAARGRRPAGRDPLPPQQPGRHGRERRQPRRGPRRQVRRARGDRPGHRLVAPGADDPVRPMPRPQVRAGHPGGLLPAPGDPVSGLRRRALAQAERARGRRRPARRAAALGGQREGDRRRTRRAAAVVHHRLEGAAEGQGGGAQVGDRGDRVAAAAQPRPDRLGRRRLGRPGGDPDPGPGQLQHARAARSGRASRRSWPIPTTGTSPIRPRPGRARPAGGWPWRAG